MIKSLRVLLFMTSVLLLGSACNKPAVTTDAATADSTRISYQELYTQEQEYLTTYKLLDAEKGVYQIPVERAMQIIAQEKGK